MQRLSVIAAIGLSALVATAVAFTDGYAKLSGDGSVVSDGGLAGPSETAIATPDAPDGIRNELAPIESVQVISTKSFPAQHIVRVRYGLPSGCARPGGYEVQRQGNSISISVWLRLPADPTAICTMIYGWGDHSIPLEGLTPGETYKVSVNGVSKTFIG